MSDHKICVAICNFNHLKYLEQSVGSILGQTHRNLDVCIVDDGSIDQEKVSQLIRGFEDKRVRGILLENNVGKWHALNAAFSTTDAVLCTSHDADDVSLSWRLESQVRVLQESNTIHNLCGFVSCWSEDEVNTNLCHTNVKGDHRWTAGQDIVGSVSAGLQTPGINHYHTGYETAGVSALFAKWIWDVGFRFNPPGMGLRVLLSEDSDFNCRVTLGLRSTSVLLEKPYLYRRNTSTNREER